jgi:hypothetical protein
VSILLPFFFILDHFGNTISGKAVKFVKTNIPYTHDELIHRTDEDSKFFPGYRFVRTNSGKDGLRKAPPKYATQGMMMGNGAECRKTYHFVPPGYGAQVESPNMAIIHPMIIDTANREGDPALGIKSTRHGVVPPTANVGSDAMYNGMMECPCTDKWEKKLASYSTKDSGACVPAVTNAAKCFASATELGLSPVKANMTVNSSSRSYPLRVQCHGSEWRLWYDMVLYVITEHSVVHIEAVHTHY